MKGFDFGWFFGTPKVSVRISLYIWRWGSSSKLLSNEITALENFRQFPIIWSSEVVVTIYQAEPTILDLEITAWPVWSFSHPHKGVVFPLFKEQEIIAGIHLCEHFYLISDSSLFDFVLRSAEDYFFLSMSEERQQILHQVSLLGRNSSGEAHENSLLIVPVLDLVISESEVFIETLLLWALI